MVIVTFYSLRHHFQHLSQIRLEYKVYKTQKSNLQCVGQVNTFFRTLELESTEIETLTLKTKTKLFLSHN